MLPGGMVALVVSGPLYNAARPRRLIVEVVAEQLPSAGALLAPLPPAPTPPGRRAVLVPANTDSNAEPIAALAADEIDPTTDGSARAYRPPSPDAEVSLTC